MLLLIPTHDANASIASISLVLIQRYWPDHPPMHVLHDEVKPRFAGDRVTFHPSESRGNSPGSTRLTKAWLGPVREFLRDREDELFLLMLDDYAICGPVREERIWSAAHLMREDLSVGMFPLCWYPAARRTPRPGRPGIMTLTGTPILLQAAIWRRSWFVELADQMGADASAWSFEAAATQAARRAPRDICAFDIPEPAYVGGHLIDAFDKTHWALPYHNLMHRGEPEERHDGFLRREGFEFPARGLGDTVARIAGAVGAGKIAGAYSRITGRDCGCERRRRQLNRMLPYRRMLEESHSTDVDF